ncbi:CD209 antigen-like protein C isoform X1 [Pygocentrus nattereri]|uniref:C-type lectin domain-containing protein n=2 Tax=Pygocentrus nattereri TaxID=42514 RepID=A0AAR2K7L6_PYGNA|nr:CD209 antigen-like protein C isoform X1 [Pygocentrus nattereri]
MEPQISSEYRADSTRAKAEREPNMGKRTDKVWMRLALLFTVVLLVKALLFTCATFLLRMDVSEDLQSNRTCERNNSTEIEILQLREDLQKLTTLLHHATKDSRCQLCPKQWHWLWGHCYFFSVGLEKDRKWAESVDYCREHNASLAVIQDATEMQFILGQMMTFSEMPFLWLGLTDSQEEGVWIWQDGTSFHEHSFIKLQWDSEERDCADLRGNGSVFAANCKVYGPWLCEKTMEPENYPTSTPA